MNTTSDHAHRQARLRSLAVAKLTGTSTRTPVRAEPSDALGVLFELASSPATATGALALLHELQVHQVEVDLQDEELCRSRVELETALNRQVELYDCAPVGYVTIDHGTVLRELNHTAASQLECERDFMVGRALESYLTSESVHSLHAMLGRLKDGSPGEFADLELRGQKSGGRRVHASARLDPAGGGYLVALMEAAGAPPQPAAWGNVPST